jgi:hypothetical protein
MNPFDLSSLPAVDRALLNVALRVVPKAERGDWLRCWHAELWHRRHPRSGRVQSARDLYPGLVCDSAWLRTNSWHQALIGTAFLCILVLGAILFVSALPLFVYLHGEHATFLFVSGSANSFFCEAALVTLVGLATSARTIEYRSSVAYLSQLRAQLFQAVKLTLLLLIAFFISSDLTQPFHAAHPFSAEIMQPQFFVVIALLGLRWTFRDQDNRCKQCLRELATPARVGKPSWNFIESNGTELLCRGGHGLLSVPEIETSWRRSSRWIAS